MIIKNLPQIGEPILRETAAKVKDFNDPKLKRIVKNLKDTMLANDLYGIAAPQLGKSLAIFVTEVRAPDYLKNEFNDELRVFINPKIINTSTEKTVIYEGCGSVANGAIRAPIKRSKTVLIEAFDEKGSKFKLKASGILGRVILHEYDHLEGKLFTDLSDPKEFLEQDVFRKLAKEKKINLNIEFISPETIKAGV